MKRKIIHSFCIFILLLINNSCFAQLYTYSWARSIDASVPNTALSITQTTKDLAGNIYNIGMFSGTADFDPGVGIFSMSGNLIGSDLFIQKLDNTGNFVWAKKIGGSSADVIGTKIKTDLLDNVVVIGTFNDMVDFDPANTIINNIVNKGPQDIFVLKLDPAGNFMWAKTIGSPTSVVECNDIHIDNINEILVGGSFNDLVDFDPNSAIQYLSTNGSSDAYVLKLSNNGNYLWATSFVGNTYATVKSIAVENNNNIVIAGNFIGTVDFNPGSASNSFTSKVGSTDIFINKLTVSGNYITAKVFGGNQEDELSSMKIDNSEEFILAGNFNGICDFDPNGSIANLTSNGFSQDCFISKLKNNFDYLWAKKIGGTSDEYLFDISLDNLKNIFSTGSFSGSVDFNPGPATNNLLSTGNTDVFISKLNTNGDYMNASKIGNIDYDKGMSIFVDNAYSIFASGNYNGTVDFDPNAGTSNLTAIPSNNGNLYSLQWNQCSPDILYIYGTGCNYTLNGQTYTSNGVFYQNYTNVDGCDSILTVNVSGSSSNTTLNIANCTGTYTFNGQTYTNSGTYTQNYTNVSGCDSNYILNLYLGGTSYTTLNESSCDFYFWNNQFYFNTGIYVDTFANFNGCDSIVTLNLTINSPTFAILYDTACGPTTYNGTLHNASGVYTNIFTTVNGCDSVVDYTLTIIPVPVTYITDTACEIYVLNGQNYISSGTYLQELTNVAGCDSNVQLSLVIYNITKSIAQTGNFLSSNQLQPTNYQWVKCNPFTIIANATAQNYTATETGQYAVILNANGCTDTSNCIQVTIEDVNNVVIQNNITLYPNPATDFLQLDFLKMIDLMNIKIKSISGQTLIETNAKKQSSTQISVANLANGIYFIELIDGKNKSMLKFIKQ